MPLLNIDSFFNRTIPEPLRHSSDPKKVIRAKVLVGLYASNFVATTVFFLVFLGAMLLTDNSTTQGLIGSGIAFMTLIFQAVVFYTMCNVAVSAIIFSMIFFGFTLCAVIISGGWESPVLLIFFCSPVISFLVGGRSEGLYTAALTCICGIVFMYSHKMGFTVMQVVAEEHMEALRLAIWLVSIVVLVCCLTVYDLLLERHIK